MPVQPPAQPPPAKPKQPADPSVYGGQWGNTGGAKKPGPAPTDRPDKIETPPDTSGEPEKPR